MASVTASTGSAAKRSAVGIIASAGGIPALFDLLPALPPSIPFPIIIAQHLPAALPSSLPAVLAYRVDLPVKWAEAGERPRAGTIYLLPPGCELAVGRDGFAIAPLLPFASSWLACPDILLRSLAESYGAGAVGIVLSGMLTAGIAGLRAIRGRGGITMAQTVDSSSFVAMPAGAIDLGKAELVLSPAGIAEALIVLARQWGGGRKPLKPSRARARLDLPCRREPIDGCDAHASFTGVDCRGGVIYSDPQWLGVSP